MKNRSLKALKVYLCMATVSALILTGCGDTGRGNYTSTGNSKSSDIYSGSSYDGSSGSSYDGSSDSSYESSLDVSEGMSEDVIDTPAASAESGEDGYNTASGQAEVLDSQKIIYTANVELQTLEYDDTKSQINKMITDAGGFIENQTESDGNYHWYYSDDSQGGVKNWDVTARIPTAKYGSFLDGLDKTGKVMSRSDSAENITRSYADNQVQIEALQKEEQRLLEMMDKAEDISDMIAVEQRLTEVESNLSMYQSYKAGMDTDLAFSTVTMSVQEVREYSEPEDETLGTRIINAFKDGWNGFGKLLSNLLVALIYLLPYLIILAIVWPIIHKIRKNRKASGKVREKKEKRSWRRKNKDGNPSWEVPISKNPETSVKKNPEMPVKKELEASEENNAEVPEK